MAVLSSAKEYVMKCLIQACNELLTENIADNNQSMDILLNFRNFDGPLVAKCGYQRGLPHGPYGKRAKHVTFVIKRKSILANASNIFPTYEDLVAVFGRFHVHSDI